MLVYQRVYQASLMRYYDSREPLLHAGFECQSCSEYQRSCARWQIASAKFARHSWWAMLAVVHPSSQVIFSNRDWIRPRFLGPLGETNPTFFSSDENAHFRYFPVNQSTQRTVVSELKPLQFSTWNPGNTPKCLGDLSQFVHPKSSNMLGDLPVPMLLLSLLVYASALERVAPGMQMDAGEKIWSFHGFFQENFEFLGRVFWVSLKTMDF